MAKESADGKRQEITPKDVFDRSNMPSWWERLTGVGPKIAEDKKFLAFAAARYRREPRLPHPRTLVAPAELERELFARMACRLARWSAVGLAVIGVITPQSVLVVIGVAVFIAAIAVKAWVSTFTGPAIAEFTALQSRCEEAHRRVYGDSLDPEYRSTLDQMITCDEGTLAYCAAKIASEIARDPAWASPRLDVAAINVWDEVAEIAHSARIIAEDRETCERLEQGRLRNDPEVLEIIEAENSSRSEALALLAARVHAFADYRDRVHRRGMAALRDSNTISRAMRRAADEVAVAKLR